MTDMMVQSLKWLDEGWKTRIHLLAGLFGSCLYQWFWLSSLISKNCWGLFSFGWAAGA